MSLDNEKDIQNFRNRLSELADRSYSQSCYTFSDFLGLSEMTEYYKSEQTLSYAHVEMFGGYEESERCILRLGNPAELGYEQPYPIGCVRVTPVLAKFADKLTHRDYLGALMNLGIKRETLGDIKVSTDCAYIFCLEKVAEYICENLNKIRHTSVNATYIDIYEESGYGEMLADFADDEPVSKQIQVMSMRADAVISKVYNLSRSDALSLFRSQKVFINGRLSENNAQTVRTGDIINARGMGKCKIASQPSETRKGKLAITMHIW